MSTQDLSLLTADEREIANRFSNRNNLGDGVPNFLLRALIAARSEIRAIREQAIGVCVAEKAADSAWMNVLSRSSEALGLPMPDGVSGEAHAIARAENKRKDEVIANLIAAAEDGRNLLRQMAEVSSLAGRKGAHERADAIDAVLKEAATVTLQSEKGGE
ncbi:MAG: hypothetical protein KF821_01785 [Anaerolineales bacterium]|nr:hypothetical protein [Anaerolineales bacterium]